MTGVRIEITDNEIQNGLARVAKAGKDTRPLMESIAGYMLFSTQRRFETETGPDGKKWLPLSPRTANKRIGNKRRGTENILRVTNRLFSSITGEATASQAVVGTNVVYAAIHQQGGTINVPARQRKIRLRRVGRRSLFARTRGSRAHKRFREVDATIPAHTITIPARPYLGFSDTDRREIGEITSDYLGSAAGGAR